MNFNFQKKKPAYKNSAVLYWIVKFCGMLRTRVFGPTFLTLLKNLYCIEQYFPVVLFTMLYKVVLTFSSVD